MTYRKIHSFNGVSVAYDDSLSLRPYIISVLVHGKVLLRTRNAFTSRLICMARVLLHLHNHRAHDRCMYMPGCVYRQQRDDLYRAITHDVTSHLHVWISTVLVHCLHLT